MDILKRTWAEIDLDAAEKNFRTIRENIGDAKLCCVVKADAYGHGAGTLANLYSSLGADFFAVSNIDEAIELRDAGIEKPILILGYTPVAEAKKLAKYQITQAVFGLDYAIALSRECVREKVKIDVHVKVDTGMSRIGFMCQSFPEDMQSIYDIAHVCALDGLKVRGIMAHFSVADEGARGRAYTEDQLESFRFVLSELEDMGITFEYVHHANSGATEYYPDARFSMVRAGIILYGLSPNPALKPRFELSPVMKLKSTISFVKELRAGCSVSYGRTFTATHNMVVATVPIGYADGYFRSFSEAGYMSVDGKKAKILGRICMDQTIIDVTDIENVKIGDEVTVFSNGEDNAPTVNDLAKMAGTINYEIICAVSKRVPREYIKNGKVVDVMYKL
ncbi:MAG: alanine racemase [Eubacteriales bacterium]|nr:alanine racemase [Eubacteriales bacterium]